MVRTVSTSAVIEGRFDLGQLPQGAYTVFLAERERVPGLTMEMNVADGQDAQEAVFGLGECNIEVTVLDEKGRRVDADNIKLFAGGTDAGRHSFKRAKSIRDGTWRVNGLLPGQYLVSARLGDVSGGAMLNLTPGRNACTIRVGPRAVVGEGPEHSSEPLAQ